MDRDIVRGLSDRRRSSTVDEHNRCCESQLCAKERGGTRKLESGKSGSRRCSRCCYLPLSVPQQCRMAAGCILPFPVPCRTILQAFPFHSSCGAYDLIVPPGVAARLLPHRNPDPSRVPSHVPCHDTCTLHSCISWNLPT